MDYIKKTILLTNDRKDLCILNINRTQGGIFANIRQFKGNYDDCILGIVCGNKFLKQNVTCNKTNGYDFKMNKDFDLNKSIGCVLVKESMPYKALLWGGDIKKNKSEVLNYLANSCVSSSKINTLQNSKKSLDLGNFNNTNNIENNYVQDINNINNCSNNVIKDNCNSISIIDKETEQLGLNKERCVNKESTLDSVNNKSKYSNNKKEKDVQNEYKHSLGNDNELIDSKHNKTIKSEGNQEENSESEKIKNLNQSEKVQNKTSRVDIYKCRDCDGNLDRLSLFEDSEEELESTITSAFKEEKTSFFEMISEQIDELFNTYPEEPRLGVVVPNSKWVKVNFEDSDRSYVIGLIYENEVIKYVAYGVPGKKDDEVPDRIDEYNQWIPLDSSNTDGDGYFVMFQDAETGETVKF